MYLKVTAVTAASAAITAATIAMHAILPSGVPDRELGSDSVGAGMPAEGKASACDTEDCAKDDESEERDVQTDDGCRSRSGDW